MDSDSDFYGTPLSSSLPTTQHRPAHTISPGDEEVVSALEGRVARFDIVTWWDRQSAMTAHIHHQQQLLQLQQIQHPAADQTTAAAAHPFDPSSSVRHPSESIPAFLARLPPATTDWRPGMDWIWIQSPYQLPRAAPALGQFRQGGAERLALLTAFQTMASAAAAPAGRVARDVGRARREAVADLTALAGACGMVSGKWMLFPEPGHVNEVWGRVARATAEGSLGDCAKVETRVTADKERLVCVYTRDFRDKDDVARVLRRMAELELVRPGGRLIYYKSGKWW